MAPWRAEKGRVRFVLGAAAVLTGLAGAGLHAANAASGRVVAPSFWLMGLVASLAYGGAALAVHRSPAALLRRLLGAVGLTQGASLLAQEWARFSPTAPLQAWSLWLGSWLWAAGYVAILSVLPLVLPEGRLLSARWRPALALSGSPWRPPPCGGRCCPTRCRTSRRGCGERSTRWAWTRWPPHRSA